jgi:hypothetical protein
MTVSGASTPRSDGGLAIVTRLPTSQASHCVISVGALARLILTDGYRGSSTVSRATR